MTDTAVMDTILSRREGQCLHVTLNRPHRGNSLTIELLSDLLATLDTEITDPVDTLVLTGQGSAFSTGGDVSEFHARSGDPAALTAYSDRLVSLLNQVILRLHDLPCAIIAAVNGPVTGGSLGLMLVADHVVMHETAFVQPYYARMGFAPDGGWTAMLPGRIGPARAANWLARDWRAGARDALELGLADAVSSGEAWDDAIPQAVAQFGDLDRSVIRTSRHLITPPSDLAARLDAERAAFLDMIGRDDTRERMASFLSAAGGR